MTTFNIQTLDANEQLAFAKVEHFATEYAAAPAMLLRDGVTLESYVQTALGDCGGTMNDALASALRKLQSQFGQPIAADNWLSSKLGQSDEAADEVDDDSDFVTGDSILDA